MEAKSIVKQRDGRESGRPADAGALRAHLHGMWASVAPSWGEHAEFVDARGALVAQELLDRTGPQPGERVLELACGPGGVGLAAARLVGPGGEVVLSDVAAEMTQIAAQRAATQGLANVTARPLDLEDIAEPDDAYDVVLCREGLMFATDPAHAAYEIRRVLMPGGRVGVAVWDARERNPWLGLVFDAVSAQTGKSVPPPGVPGPFSLGDADLLAGLLADAGYSNVEISRLSTPLRAGSFDEWWARTAALAGPLAQVLASLPEPATQALRVRLQEAIAPYTTPAGVDVPGVTLIASAHA
jgi:SAM-dependent methyltransferase